MIYLITFYLIEVGERLILSDRYQLSFQSGKSLGLVQHLTDGWMDGYPHSIKK